MKFPPDPKEFGSHTVDCVAADLTALVPALVRRDAQAFQRLVETTHLDVWRLCAYLVDREAADDLAQDTFLRAYRALPTFRGEAGPHTWLLTIARRVCAGEIDRRARIRDLTLRVRPAADHHPDHAAETDLRLLLAELTDERRTAFVLTQVLGCDYAEAAAICGVPIGTIRSRVARARDDLAAAVSAGTGNVQMHDRRSIGHN